MIKQKIVYVAPDPTSPSKVAAIDKGERGAVRVESSVGEDSPESRQSTKKAGS